MNRLFNVSATNEPFQVLLSSSRNASQVANGDLANHSGPSEVLYSSIYSEAIPEPAMVTLILMAGGGMVFIRRLFR